MEPNGEAWKVGRTRVWKIQLSCLLRCQRCRHVSVSIRKSRGGGGQPRDEEITKLVIYLIRFSVGRATALVLDSGGSITSAIPVYDGLVLKRGNGSDLNEFLVKGWQGLISLSLGILRQPIGGNTVTNQIMEELKRSFDYTITPQYLVAEKQSVDAGQPPKFKSRDRPNTTDSYNKAQQEVKFTVWISWAGHVS